MQLQALVYLFAQIAGVTDPQTIINGAKCFSCIPPGMLLQALVYLASQIAGGTSSGDVLCVTGADPTTAPSGSCGIAYRIDTGAIFLWDGANWVFKV
jgi:hypothetical protein